MPQFGYSPERSDVIKNRLDHAMQAIEGNAQTLKYAVSAVPTPAARVDELVGELREVVSTLQEIVDQRTDGEA